MTKDIQIRFQLKIVLLCQCLLSRPMRDRYNNELYDDSGYSNDNHLTIMPNFVTSLKISVVMISDHISFIIVYLDETSYKVILTLVISRIS